MGMEVEQSEGKMRLHLDNCIRETLNEYKEFSTKSLRPKQVPIQLGLLLEKDSDDCPIVPAPRKQKHYRLFIAKLLFSASWTRFYISFAVEQLAGFCAPAGKTHWAALHHLMKNLDAHSSLKLSYRKCSALSNDLTGFADSDRAMMNLLSRSTTGNAICTSTIARAIVL
jgi:hypothetical protein